MHIIPDNAQHIGGREQQEDSFGFSAFDQEDLIHKRGYLAIVADGMGGMTAGREASGIAVQAFLQYYQDLSVEGSIPHLLRASVLHANERVCHFAESVGLEGRVGTTLIAAVIKEHHLYWLSVGDSRIYLFRNKELIQLTEDHVYANELYEEVARGKLSKEDVEEDPQKDALTSFVGLQELLHVDVNIKPFPLAVIQATDEEAILHHDIYDKKPLPHWGSGRVTLLGDAAHPMLPNLGQGGAQAMEDAIVLADCLSSSKDIAQANFKYERERIRRTTMVVRRSRKMARMMQLENPVAIGFRNVMLKTVPSHILASRLHWVVGHEV